MTCHSHVCNALPSSIRQYVPTIFPSVVRSQSSSSDKSKRKLSHAFPSNAPDWSKLAGRGDRTEVINTVGEAEVATVGLVDTVGGTELDGTDVGTDEMVGSDDAVGATLLVPVGDADTTADGGSDATVVGPSETEGEIDTEGAVVVSGRDELVTVGCVRVTSEVGTLDRTRVGTHETEGCVDDVGVLVGPGVVDGCGLAVGVKVSPSTSVAFSVRKLVSVLVPTDVG